jgi:hypothetical protein
MNLDCLNDIITDGLAIHIDISDIDSWNLNTGFTSVSLTQWADAKSDNINLYDFGLTEYDNGRVDRMYDTLDITPQDLKVELYRVGYNTGGTAYYGETQYDLYPMSAVTTGSVGNYFELDGGYLQGFFKLKDYNYELFPQRYNLGITIEAIFRIDPDSSGTLFLMGARAEDKYNPEFSGESETIEVTTVHKVSSGVVGRTRTVVSTETGFTGVQTSEENYLNAYKEVEEVRDAFASWENMTYNTFVRAPQSGNTKSNVIAFSLLDDKRIEYKYIDDDNLVRTQSSTNKITTTGWTIMDLVFEPEEVIEDYDPSIAACYERRKGTLKFFVNGREFWRLNNFDEFFFRGMANDKEKQIGVPYSISFGGGSFGLKHSYHYEHNTLELYTDQDQQYIENNFAVTTNPLNEDPCYTGDTGGSYNSLGLVLSADTTTFHTEDECNPSIDIPTPVMDVKHTGGTGTTTLNEYYIEFDTVLPSLSNRDIKLEVDIYDTGIFKNVDSGGNQVYSTISLVAISTVDLEIKQETIYSQPVYSQDTNNEAPFSTYDGNIYQYEDEETRLLIDGQTGYPVLNEYNESILEGQPQQQISLSGKNDWKSLETTFQLTENTGLQAVKVGILLESTDTLNEDFLLYIKNFKFNEQDILVQDPAKDNLLIEQNFDSSYKGGIQKLRIYDRAFNSQEVLHNAKIELKNNPGYAYAVSGGGRIIYI